MKVPVLTTSFVPPVTELVKIKLQMQQETTKKPVKGASGTGFSGPVECAKHIHRIGGFQGLYRGFWTTALRDSLAFAIYFSFYEGTCRALTPASETPGCQMSPIRTMIVSLTFLPCSDTACKSLEFHLKTDSLLTRYLFERRVSWISCAVQNEERNFHTPCIARAFSFNVLFLAPETCCLVAPWTIGERCILKRREVPGRYEIHYGHACSEDSRFEAHDLIQDTKAHIPDFLMSAFSKPQVLKRNT